MDTPTLSREPSTTTFASVPEDSLSLRSENIAIAHVPVVHVNGDASQDALLRSALTRGDISFRVVGSSNLPLRTGEYILITTRVLQSPDLVKLSKRQERRVKFPFFEKAERFEFESVTAMNLLRIKFFKVRSLRSNLYIGDILVSIRAHMKMVERSGSPRVWYELHIKSPWKLEEKRRTMKMKVQISLHYDVKQYAPARVPQFMPGKEFTGAAKGEDKRKVRGKGEEEEEEEKEDEEKEEAAEEKRRRRSSVHLTPPHRPTSMRGQPEVGSLDILQIPHKVYQNNYQSPSRSPRSPNSPAISSPSLSPRQGHRAPDMPVTPPPPAVIERGDSSLFLSPPRQRGGVSSYPQSASQPHSPLDTPSPNSTSPQYDVPRQRSHDSALPPPLYPLGPFSSPPPAYPSPTSVEPKMVFDNSTPIVPQGWEKIRDERTGVPLYRHMATGQVKRDLPHSLNRQAPQPLPFAAMRVVEALPAMAMMGYEGKDNEEEEEEKSRRHVSRDMEREMGDEEESDDWDDTGSDSKSTPVPLNRSTPKRHLIPQSAFEPEEREREWEHFDVVEEEEEEEEEEEQQEEEEYDEEEEEVERKRDSETGDLPPSYSDLSLPPSYSKDDISVAYDGHIRYELVGDKAYKSPRSSRKSLLSFYHMQTTRESWEAATENERQNGYTNSEHEHLSLPPSFLQRPPPSNFSPSSTSVSRRVDSLSPSHLHLPNGHHTHDEQHTSQSPLSRSFGYNNTRPSPSHNTHNSKPMFSRAFSAPQATDFLSFLDGPSHDPDSFVCNECGAEIVDEDAFLRHTLLHTTSDAPPYHISSPHVDSDRDLLGERGRRLLIRVCIITFLFLYSFFNFLTASLILTLCRLLSFSFSLSLSLYLSPSPSPRSIQ